VSTTPATRDGAPTANSIARPVQDRDIRTTSSSIALTAQRRLLRDLIETITSRQILEELVKRDLKVRYKRSTLGLFWTMLNPLLMMLVTTIAFSAFFKFAIHNFPIYFMSAYVIWGFFSQASVSASSSVLDSAGLARKIYVPAALFPLASVSAGVVNLVVSLVPLMLLVAVTGGQFSWALLSLPVPLLLVALFTFGLGLILSAASVFFHDLIHTYQVILMAWMYLTPIFYPVNIVPDQWSFIFHANPLFYFVEIFRQPIYAGTWPDPFDLLIATAYALGTAAVGWWYFERCRNSFSSYL
jgi:ABC-2 type transport system permease protein